MVFILALSLCLSSVFTGVGNRTAKAADFYSGDWHCLEQDDGTVSVYYCGNASEIEVPATIDGKKVSIIGTLAFKECENPVRVTVPEGVTTLNSQAFSGCSNLVSVTLPESLEKIGSCAFEGCSSLTELNIPSGVKTIGDSILIGCSSLRRLTVSEENTVYSGTNGCNAIIKPNGKILIAACNTTDLPEDIVEIGDGAFSPCADMTSITLPESLWTIGSEAFSGCRSLESLRIPANTTNFGTRMFDGCTNLKELTVAEDNVSYESRNCNAIIQKGSNYLEAGCSGTVIPEGITKIYANAFHGCDGLERIDIPDGITRIDRATFYGCSGLKEIRISSDVTEIASNAFYGCSGMESISLPENITKIDNYVFSGCHSLETVGIPSGVTTIACGAFQDCRSLRRIVLPDGLTTLESSAFADCTGLEEIAIPSGVTKLESRLFQGCSALKNFVVPSGVTSIGDDVFEGSGLETIEISETVTKISEDAFFTSTIYTSPGCENLRQIRVSKDNPKYDSRDNCNALIETATDTLLMGCNGTTIPEGIKTINKYAFWGSRSLESIEIPASVTSVEGHIFTKCSNLKTITVAEGNTRYESRNCNGIIDKNENALVAACSATKIPENISTILAAYSGCDSITSFRVPSHIRRIRGLSFYRCTGLTSVIIPDGVTELGPYAFSFCVNLKRIKVPASVTSFGQGSFHTVFLGCPKDMVIYTTEGSTIATYAEENGIRYTFEPMPEEEMGSATPAPTPTPTPAPTPTGNTAAPSLAPKATAAPAGTSSPTPNVGGKIVRGQKYNVGNNRYKVTSASSDKKTVEYVNVRKKNVKSVVVPKTVKISGVSYKVTSVAKNAFANHKKLKSVTVGANVKTIGKGAFSGCKNLKKITLRAARVKSVGKNALKGVKKNVVIKVPKGKKKAYKKLFTAKTGFKKTMKLI